MISVQTPTGPKAFTLRGIQTPAGPKAIATGSVRTPTGDKIFYSSVGTGAFEILVNRTSVYGNEFFPGATTATTQSSTATPINGSSPYTYAWTLVTGDVARWTIISPGSASTSFRGTLTSQYDTLSAVFRITVTDASGQTQSQDVNAFIQNLGGLGGIIP